MKKYYFVFFYIPYLAFTQSFYWKQVKEKEITNYGQKYIQAQHYLTYELNLNTIKNILQNAPHENNVIAEKSNLIIELPFPDGSLKKFRVSESPVMHPDLASKYPEIKTFAVKGLEDVYATGRIDYTYQGFHAMIQTLEGTLFIDPYGNQTQTYYLVYWKHDFVTDKVFQCLVSEEMMPENQGIIEKTHSQRAVGSVQRKYRLAVSATGEYTAFHGGTKSGALSAITTTVNRVNQVLNRDLAIRFELVANNDTLIFTNPSTDPFTNGNASSMLTQNQTTIDNRIGNSNYDIGHVFATDGAGLAQIKALCSVSNKAKGVTGIANPVGDPFDIDYVAHEMGHQMGGYHTFNNCSGNGSTTPPAYEPGGGVTIMAYAGICGFSYNIASNSIDIYHNGSFYEIAGNTLQISGQTGWNCAQKISTGNNPPEIDPLNQNFYIPISTPFQLTASATDFDGDSVTYCWEQVDAGPISSLSNPTGTAPLFRSWLPTKSPTRIFPRLQELLNNTAPKGEKLPTYTRELNFAVTVRDNKTNGGGSDYLRIKFYATSSAGPFTVTYPNTNITWKTGTMDTVKWSVANTNASPVNCQYVNIKLSVDGGYTYPYTLAANTPNDGIEVISVPTNITGLPKTTCRVKVEAADNIFFDISNTNFKIEQGPTTSTQEVIGFEKWVTVIPNPTSEQWFVLIQNQTSAPISIELYDLSGKLIQILNELPGNQEIIVPTNSLAPGTYLMKVYFDNQIVMKKVIKW